MNYNPADIVSECELRVQHGILLDEDFLKLLREIELDVLLPQQLRTRAAAVATQEVAR